MSEAHPGTDAAEAVDPAAPAPLDPAATDRRAEAAPAPLDPAATDRRGEVAAAALVGDPEPARQALGAPDPRERATALGALRRSGALRAEDVRAAVADPSPLVRRRAAEEVAALAGPDGDGPIPPDVSLLPLLDDADPTVVEVGAWASGERRPAEDGAVARLVELAGGHDDALVREAAVAALGSIGDADGLPAILRATDDKATVRRRAIIALAPFDGPEVEAALRRALEDRDWQVRQAAEDLLR